MYVPKPFAVDDSELYSLIERHPFGSLMTYSGGRYYCTHIPFLLDARENEICLWGHIARANPHGDVLYNAKVLVAFVGAHSYISPTWYETDKAVPTWNYLAAHVQGTSQVIEKAEEVAAVLKRQVRQFEPRWLPDEELLAQLVNSITMFRIDAQSIEGSHKLSQHHSAERKGLVADALSQLEGENASEISRRMLQQVERENRSHSDSD